MIDWPKARRFGLRRAAICAWPAMNSAMSCPDRQRLTGLCPVMQRVEPFDGDARGNRQCGTLTLWDVAELQPVLDVLSGDIATYGGGQLGGAAVEQIDGLLNSGFDGHERRLVQSSLQHTMQTRLRATPTKSADMKTIGDQAKAFRLARGWSVKEMAAACKTSRQNIETLEAKGDRVPRYVKELAHVMGTTVDTLMEGRYRAGGASIVEAPALSVARVQEDRPEPGEIEQALRVLAEALQAADTPTRAAVAPLFALLAQEPERLESVASTLMRLIPERKLTAHNLQEDRREGQAITALLPSLANKEQQGAKRNPVQSRGRT